MTKHWHEWEKETIERQCIHCGHWSNATGCTWAQPNGDVLDRPAKDCGEFMKR